MIIDFHTHLLPNAVQTKFHDRTGVQKQGRKPTTIEDVLELAKMTGVDISVISNPRCALPEMDRDQQLEAIKVDNRINATLQEKYDSIYAFSATVPYGDDAFLREFERAVKEDGLKGAWITSSYQGHYPDDDEALPFFQLATELDVPVVIHPPDIGFGEERMRDYRLASSIGRPMDNALAIGRLIVRGIFEKFPTLKLVGTHLGGGICEMIGRMDYAYKLRDDPGSLGSYEPLLIKHPPSHYLKMMYLESTCYHPPAARCVIDTVGIDRFVFGTDSPPLKAMKSEGVDMIRRMNLPAADERKWVYENAKKLLKI